MTDLEKRYQNAIKEIGGANGLVELSEIQKRVLEKATTLEKKVHILENIIIAKKETPEEKENRIFNGYKGVLKRIDNKKLRFLCIEYTCRFPSIDPYKMAVALIKDGYTVIYDDSTLSAAKNKQKENKVKKMLSET